MVVAATYVSGSSARFTHSLNVIFFFSYLTWRYKFCYTIEYPIIPIRQFLAFRLCITSQIKMTVGVLSFRWGQSVFYVYHDFELCWGHCCYDFGYPPSSFNHAHGYVHLSDPNAPAQRWFDDCSLHIHCHGLGKSSSTPVHCLVRISLMFSNQIRFHSVFPPQELVGKFVQRLSRLLTHHHTSLKLLSMLVAIHFLL